MRLGERYGKIEYRGCKVIQRWRGLSGYVRLSHLLMSFLLLVGSTLCNRTCLGALCGLEELYRINLFECVVPRLCFYECH